MSDELKSYNVDYLEKKREAKTTKKPGIVWVEEVRVRNLRPHIERRRISRFHAGVTIGSVN
jgi:hypothetical protein